MNKLKSLRVRIENLQKATSELHVIADDIDVALKSATKVVTPAEIRETATRITDSARNSAAHPRDRG